MFNWMKERAAKKSADKQAKQEVLFASLVEKYGREAVEASHACFVHAGKITEAHPSTQWAELYAYHIGVVLNDIREDKLWEIKRKKREEEQNKRAEQLAERIQKAREKAEQDAAFEERLRDTLAPHVGEVKP